MRAANALGVSVALLLFTGCTSTPDLRRSLAAASSGTVRLEFGQGLSWEPFCTGLSTEQGLLTNEHCLQLIKGKIDRYTVRGISADGNVINISAAQVSSAEGPAWASRDNGSAGLDFVLLRTEIQSALSASSLNDLVPSEKLSPSLAVVTHGGRVAHCKLKDVCGSELSYVCDPATELGWSGSGVWQVTSSGASLVGIHKASENSETGRATAWTTIVGRVKTLRTEAQEKALVDTKAYQHVRAPACPAPKPPFLAKAIPWLWADSLFPEDGDHFWAVADEAVLMNAKTNKAVRTIGGADFSRLHGLNGIRRAGGGAYVLFSLNPEVAISKTGEPTQWLTTPFHSVRDALAVAGDLLLAGDSGICVVKGAGCERISGVRASGGGTRPPWTANSLTLLRDGTVLAVGLAPDGATLGASCGWYRKIEGAWSEIGRCPPGPAARAAESYKTSTEMGSGALVGASDGGIYSLRSNGEPRRVEIDGLPGGLFEDSVRGLARLGSDELAVVSSDGSLRLLKIRQGEEVKLSFDPNRQLLDRAIWLKDVVAGDGWVAILGQSHQVQIITISD